MPAGAGKSLCFQIPALIFDGISIIISPLISLMQDQVSALKLYGVSVACINSKFEQSELNRILKNISAY
jgi:ATP-dependent DNA helicase RecQ